MGEVERSVTRCCLAEFDFGPCRIERCSVRTLDARVVDLGVLGTEGSGINPVAAGIDQLKARAKGMAGGLEAELSERLDRLRAGATDPAVDETRTRER